MNRLRAIIGFSSALLLVGAVALWVRSVKHTDVAVLSLADGQLQGAASCRHQVWVCFTNLRLDGQPWKFQRGSDSADNGAMFIDGILDTADATGGRFGFHYARRTLAGSNLADASYFVVGFPHGVVVALLALPVIGGLWSGVRSWRWKRAGRGARCGYDLRESKERCPECGAAIVNRATGTDEPQRREGTEATL